MREPVGPGSGFELQSFLRSGRLRIAAGRAHVRDQLERAADSVVLNLAEERARRGDAGRNHYRIAAGSAAEASACSDLVGTAEAAAQQPKLRRVGAMLRGLTR